MKRVKDNAKRAKYSQIKDTVVGKRRKKDGKRVKLSPNEASSLACKVFEKGVL